MKSERKSFRVRLLDDEEEELLLLPGHLSLGWDLLLLSGGVLSLREVVVVVVVEGIGDGGEGGRINALLCVTDNGRRKWKRDEPATGSE